MLFPGLKPDFSPSPTAAASASRPPQQFIQSASSPFGFGGLTQSRANTTTGPAPAPTNTPPPPSGGGGGGGSLRDRMQRGEIPWDDNLLNSGGNPDQARIDYENRARGEINSGYDAYFSQLDDILNTSLPSQRQAQEGIAQSQYNQGINTLTSQKDTGLSDLGRERTKAEQSQSKTLNDIGTNLRNSFMAGNVYLGARGAGDSSAANQYSYALTKLGSQQRGDVTSQFNDIQNDISDREFKLKNIFDTETRNLQEGLNQQISSIASWFSEQQNALKQAKAQGQISRGQDLASLSQNLLNVALQQLQTAQAEAANRRSALEQWAMNNSQNISQLKQNLGQVSQVSYNHPTAQPILGAPQVAANGGLFAPAGYGGNDDRRTDIFGRPI